MFVITDITFTGHTITDLLLILWQNARWDSGFSLLTPTGCSRNRHHVGNMSDLIFPKWLADSQKQCIFTGLALTTVSHQVEICWKFGFLNKKKSRHGVFTFFHFKNGVFFLKQNRHPRPYNSSCFSLHDNHTSSHNFPYLFEWFCMNIGFFFLTFVVS